MSSSIFVNSKDVFLDIVNAKDYIQLDRVSTIYQDLKDSIKKPLKMILFYGKPGTGKSIFLNIFFSPPTIIANFELFAPAVPPETGASKKPKLFFFE